MFCQDVLDFVKAQGRIRDFMAEMTFNGRIKTVHHNLN